MVAAVVSWQIFNSQLPSAGEPRCAASAGVGGVNTPCAFQKLSGPAPARLSLWVAGMGQGSVNMELGSNP